MLAKSKKTVTECEAASCAIPLVAVRAGFTLAARDVAAFEQSALPLDLGEAERAQVDLCPEIRLRTARGIH